jgi:hypothetical protein
MKKLFNNKYVRHLVVIVLITIGVSTGCNDILEEQPRAALVPSFFETAQGIEAGLISAYALNRYFYGTEGGLQMTEGFGTDNWFHAQQTTNPVLATYNNITPSEGAFLSLWNWAYPAINTCNGIIEFGSAATDLSDENKAALIAEARYIRAHWYFLMVQSFGGVSIDLGSGDYAFNTSASSAQSRASSAEVWDGIIEDLEFAAANLPEERPDQRGRAWRATALHVLAKAYLTRGSGDDAETNDIQNAWVTANELITNAGDMGVTLLADFADVHEEGNESNAEILWTIERNQDVNFNDLNDVFNDQTNGNRQNRSNFFFRSFYVQDHPGMIRDVENGRPWIRFKPTPWLLDVAFSNPNDTRYLKSFQNVYIANEDASADGGPALGDTAIYFMPKWEADAIADKPGFLASTTIHGVWFPEDPGHIALDGGFYSLNEQNKHYPSLSKFNALARPAGTGATDPNIASTRPFIVYRFAETYLIAAEAAILLGNTTDAVSMINVVRNRASDGTDISITAGDLVGAHGDAIDYVLDERARELCGEQMRWYDLVRTGRLIDRVHVDGSGAPPTYNRNFNGGEARYTPDGEGENFVLPPRPQAHHALRPIPQSTLDNLTDASGYSQNPGYN